MSTEREPLTFDEQGRTLEPIRRRAPKKINLQNAQDIRQEMARVYRDMRAGRIETSDGTKLVFVLDKLRQAYESEVMEKRMDQLEGQIVEPAHRLR